MSMGNLLQRLVGRGESSTVPQIVIQPREPEYASQIQRVTDIAAAVALKKMLNGKWLDICVIDQLLAMKHVVPDQEVYQVLRVLHCVNWAEMPRDLRNEVYKILGEMFHD